MKDKIILFGAGYYGRMAYKALYKTYKIVCLADNNELLAEKTFEDIPIISGKSIPEYYDGETDIVITSSYYFQISSQLISYGIREFYIYIEGFLYRTSPKETMIPIELETRPYFCKLNNEKTILFVQNAACIRTHKIATIMKRAGYKVYLLYTLAPPDDCNKEYKDTYDDFFSFTTANGIVDFVKNSEFDVVHSSNTPDILTNVILQTGKPVVFDVHDMNSLWGNDSIEELTLEYVANSYSAGNIYTSQGVLDIAKQKFDLSNKETFVLENIVLDEDEIHSNFNKLSSIDGEIHCVYEGGVVGNNPQSDRFFENIWKEITDYGIHIHYYSQSDEKYCKALEKKSGYLHYEGNRGSKELIQIMPQYDCGLALFNVTEKNRIFLETGTANKIYEYINAGIPVVVSDIESYKNFIKKYNVGGYLNPEGNIKIQIEKICQINIPYHFLTDHNLTMMSHSRQLIEFYDRVVQKFKEV